MVYLRLTEFNGSYLIFYRIDENGKPILNPDDIAIIKFRKIHNGRAEINFNGKNYRAVRLEVLEKEEDYEENKELKRIIDEKLKNLEGKLT